MIYVVRHGQTVWNLQKRKQGQMDSPLTLRGINQASLISEILKEEIDDFDDFEIVISPQWRCQQFSSIICERLGIEFSECTIEKDLREHAKRHGKYFRVQGQTRFEDGLRRESPR